MSCLISNYTISRPIAKNIRWQRILKSAYLCIFLCHPKSNTLRNMLWRRYCSNISQAKTMPKQYKCQTIIAKSILPLRRCRCKWSFVYCIEVVGQGAIKYKLQTLIRLHKSRRKKWYRLYKCYEITYGISWEYQAISTKLFIGFMALWLWLLLTVQCKQGVRGGRLEGWTLKPELRAKLIASRRSSILCRRGEKPVTRVQIS